MNLSAEQWKRVKSIVMDAMDRPTGERAGYLAEACGTDPLVRAEAESLLEIGPGGEANGGASERRLWEPRQATPGTIMPPAPGGSMLVGRRLGGYVVTRLIGIGGMGTVYEAR